jgi:hypothetical protein
MPFDVNGNYLGSFGTGRETMPAIYARDGAWPLATKNSHYGCLGAYRVDTTACPLDRTANNPDSPVIEANGVVYANSEDSKPFAVAQDVSRAREISRQLALDAADRPASIGGDQKIYSQNDGHLFVVGK